MDSPPKRMTRARAAAKANESTVKTTKIVTAAARAKSTATASTRSTAAKRKTRADEDEEAQLDAAPTRKARGRPRKVEEPEAEAPPRATRGRATKKVATSTAREESAPVRPTRGRPRKVVVEAPAEEPAPEPVKRTTRTRAASTTKPNTTTKAAAKKTVKFQEPDKENLEPPTKKEPVTTGLRGRPARRGGAAAATRVTRTTKSTATKKKPLSPKKVTQISVSRDDSEDELAGDMTPPKLMMKSPIRLPGAKKTQPLDEIPDSIVVVNTALMPPEAPGVMLGSPARRLPAAPFKETIKSPAKRIGPISFPGSALKPSNQSPEQGGSGSPSKASLLQSAAKRPQSPIKGLNLGSSFKTQQSQSAMKASLLLSPAKRAMPTMKPLTEPRQRNMEGLTGLPTMKPFVLSTPTPANRRRPSNRLMAGDELSVGQGTFDEDDVFGVPMESLEFSGRLSAILPRHADPALNDQASDAEELDVEDVCLPEETEEPALPIVDEHEEPEEQPLEITKTAEPAEAQHVEEQMIIDADATEDEEEAPEEEEPAATSPAQSSEQVQNPMFQLRDKDLNPCHDLDSDSEDELTAAFNVPTTPTRRSQRTPRTNGTGRQTKTSRVSMGGFDALADQLGSWRAHSPVKAKTPRAIVEAEEDVAQVQSATPSAQASPMMNNFFEDEMSVRPETVANVEAEAAIEEVHGDVQEPSFDDIMVTEEDVALAHEAHEMSLMEPEPAENMANSPTFDEFMDDTLSEDSQEYGDENDIPGGHGPSESPSRGPVTPVRLVMKTFNTTTKVPLKPADDSTPSPMKKRSYSASRVAPKRPSALGRNASTVSYSPEKGRKSMSGAREEPLSSAPATPVPVTPSKSDLWSSMGTPARTPRRDINPALLRGAVVYVDVYTSEGADASGIFIELLTQMGAKCTETWNWNPRESSNKVGITHVVFKDGEKHTLDKVRQSGGVVQCVGVSWVLDCERENEWLDEAPYNINTTNRPRGGARRKTIEPDALANLNAALGSSPVKGHQSRSAPSTPRNRRDSTVWMHTPSDEPEEEEDEDHEWSNIMLTPVPKTPAPDAIARYAANLGPETPSEAADEDFDDSPTKQDLLMRTCPPKSNPFRDMGAGLLSQDKDEQVLMRLMAARRKSMQFAPKIGSPLSKAW